MNRDNLAASLAPFNREFYTTLKRFQDGTSLVIDSFGASFIRNESTREVFAFDPNDTDSCFAAKCAATESK